METSISPYLKKLDSIKLDIEKIAKKAIIENGTIIKDLLKDRQLSDGKNSKGNPLKMRIGKGTGFYAESTQDYADKQGLSVPKTKNSPYNFQWTGDTFDSMGIRTINGGYEIFTIDGKQGLLETIYGEIFDLTEENNKYVNNEIILPALQKYILENFYKVN